MSPFLLPLLLLVIPTCMSRCERIVREEMRIVYESIESDMAKYPHVMSDIIALTKPRITFMAVLVAAAGLMHAGPSHKIIEALSSLLAVACLVSGSSAFNMYLERVQDKKMLRTMNRPLPAGRISAWWAVAVGGVCSFLACFLLYAASNTLTLFLGIMALVVYVFCYTPLKQKTWLSLIVGSIPGAMPVVLGYISLANVIDERALALFSWAFLWQIPHFIAISLFREKEYMNAGFPVLSARYGEYAAKWILLISSWLLVLSTGALYYSGIISLMSLGICVGLGCFFLFVCHRGAFTSPTHQWAYGAFKASLFYQGLLFAILIIDAF